MVLSTETIATGAGATCPDCKKEVEPQVLRSPAGYYIGATCDCGPYCRESDYYPTREEAEADLKSESFSRR